MTARVVRSLNDSPVAPGATPPELALTYATALAGAVLVVSTGGVSSLLAAAVTAVVAFDLFGGAVANAVPAARRRWHGPDSTRARHLLFVVAHVQPFLLALVRPDYGVGQAALLYGVTVLAAVAVLAAPLALRRAVAFAAAALGIGLVSVVAPAPAELAWLAPVLLVKLLLAHLLPDTGQAATTRTDR